MHGKKKTAGIRSPSNGRLITERQQSEDAQQEREEQYRKVVEASPNCIFVLLQNRFVLVNPAALKLFGASRQEELLGRDVFDLIQPDFHDTIRGRIVQAAQQDHALPLLEQNLLRMDGSVVIVESTSIRFQFQGQPALLVVASDVTERKRMEAGLQESEERFRHLTQAAFEGICISENGRICETNDQFVKMFGYKGNEMIGKAIVDLVASESRAIVAEAIRTGREAVYEHRLLRKDGSIFFAEAKAKMVQVGNRTLRMTALRDITERRRDEEALLQKNARIRHLNNVLHAIREVGILINRKTDSHDLLTAVCQSLVKTRGYVTVWVGQPEAESKQVLPVAHSDGDMDFLGHAPITWDDSPLGQGPTGTAIRERRAVVFDDIARDPRFAPWRDAVVASGSASIASIPIIHGERLFGVLTIKANRPNAFDAEEVVLLTDLAADVGRALHNLEGEAARQQAEESQARLVIAVEQAAETIVITDTKGTILYANPSFEKSSGYTRAEALGQNSRILKSGKQDAEYYHRMWEVLGHGEVWSGHFINRRKDGTLYEEDATISPVRDPAGMIINYVAVKRDVTREMQLEAQFRQVQKMEAIGQLAAGVAHDFNNILAVIQLQASLLKTEPDISPQQLESASEIEKAAERAASLTRQLLLFSRRQTMQLRDLDLNQSINDMTKMLRRTIGEAIQVQFKFALQPLFIHADAGMMDQVLMNLAVNAHDAMPKGGHMVIETSAVEFDESVRAQSSLARPGSFVCLSVSDTGCGIPPEILPRIFEPFFTTKDVGKGTGLGLATVFGIVQQHRGWINVYSEVGRGSIFRIYLPRLAAKSGDESGQPALTPVRGGQETILIVEDEGALRASMCKALSQLGYRVLESVSGVGALKVWEQHRHEIDLLLTDMVMPGGITGKDLAERFLSENPKLKVIYTSGYIVEVASRDFPLEEGVNFIAKPFGEHKLAQTVREKLDAITEHTRNEITP